MTMRRLLKFKHLLEAVREMVLYRFPAKKLTVVGVTGTDGKTTTALLIHHILTEAGFRTGVSSTLASPHMTLYGRGWIHRFLWRCLKTGCTHVVVEVTSIGIDQQRVWGVDFAVGVLTNIADHEHLDYHGTFEQYKATKINWLLTCRNVVANADDGSISDIKNGMSKLHTKGQKLITFGIKSKADITPKTLKYKTKLMGEFNTYNILAAAAAARVLGIKDEVIIRTIGSFEPPVGRLEVVTKKPFTVIVDFAHTPQALEKVLPVSRSMLTRSASRLIHVFGATGDRDKSKRPIMGVIAARNDDVVVLTHEDTYLENPEEIADQIETGIRNAAFDKALRDKRHQLEFYRVMDRRKAIKKALSLARPGDVVILTGVGHQRSMNIGGKEIPWNEPKIALELLGKDARKR